MTGLKLEEVGDPTVYRLREPLSWLLGQEVACCGLGDGGTPVSTVNVINL